jgi:hypothetical protein
MEFNRVQVSKLEAIRSRHHPSEQLRVCAGELAELSAALIQYDIDPESPDRISQLVDEMADGLIVMEHLKVLLRRHTPEIMRRVDYKIGRELHRTEPTALYDWKGDPR